jgi:cell division protein FtsL
MKTLIIVKFTTRKEVMEMEQKAQGAIEYLLIIGAAILVVAIVIIAITAITSSGKSQVMDANQTIGTDYNGLKDLQ